MDLFKISLMAGITFWGLVICKYLRDIKAMLEAEG